MARHRQVVREGDRPVDALFTIVEAVVAVYVLAVAFIPATPVLSVPPFSGTSLDWLVPATVLAVVVVVHWLWERRMAQRVPVRPGNLPYYRAFWWDSRVAERACSTLMLASLAVYVLPTILAGTGPIQASRPGLIALLVMSYVAVLSGVFLVAAVFLKLVAIAARATLSRLYGEPGFA